jgi:hypothetical protein
VDLASNAAHGVFARTPTPYGRRTTSMTPATGLAAASSSLSGAPPSTGLRKTAPAIDTRAALKTADVHAVLTGEDYRTDGLGSLPELAEVDGFTWAA